MEKNRNKCVLKRRSELILKQAPLCLFYTRIAVGVVFVDADEGWGNAKRHSSPKCCDAVPLSFFRTPKIDVPRRSFFVFFFLLSLLASILDRLDVAILEKDEQRDANGSPNAGQIKPRVAAGALNTRRGGGVALANLRRSKLSAGRGAKAELADEEGTRKESCEAADGEANGVGVNVVAALRGHGCGCDDGGGGGDDWGN